MGVPTKAEVKTIVWLVCSIATTSFGVFFSSVFAESFTTAYLGVAHPAWTILATIIFAAVAVIAAIEINALLKRLLKV